VYPGGGVKPKSITLGPQATLTSARRGEMYFNDGTRCFQQWQSCATCHSDARADALNWDLLNDGIGNPKNTKSLVLAHQMPPAMITGTRKDAEEEVRMGMKFILFHQVAEDDAVAIDDYLKSLKPVPSPHLVNGKLSEKAKLGQELYKKAGCIQCHSSPNYTDMKRHDVGTGTGREAGRGYVTPTYIECWRTGPYLHDGRAATIKDVFTTFNHNDEHGATSKLSQEELDALAEFVLSQ
jgi:cytochrome c peroxidase